MLSALDEFEKQHDMNAPWCQFFTVHIVKKAIWAKPPYTLQFE